MCPENVFGGQFRIRNKKEPIFQQKRLLCCVMSREKKLEDLTAHLTISSHLLLHKLTNQAEKFAQILLHLSLLPPTEGSSISMISWKQGYLVELFFMAVK